MSRAAHSVRGFFESRLELEPSEFLSCGLFEKAAPPACSDEPIHRVDHLVGDDDVGSCHQTTVLSIRVCPTARPTVDELKHHVEGLGCRAAVAHTGVSEGVTAADQGTDLAWHLAWNCQSNAWERVDRADAICPLIAATKTKAGLTVQARTTRAGIPPREDHRRRFLRGTRALDRAPSFSVRDTLVRRTVRGRVDRAGLTSTSSRANTSPCESGAHLDRPCESASTVVEGRVTRRGHRPSRRRPRSVSSGSNGGRARRGLHVRSELQVLLEALDCGVARVTVLNEHVELRARGGVEPALDDLVELSPAFEKHAGPESGRPVVG